MSGVLNDCDALLQGASVRILNPKDAFINLTPSAPGFHVNAGGTVDIPVVTVTADLIALDGNIVFTCQGGTLSNATARTVDVTYANGAAIVTATVTTNGETFARSCVIPVMRDGAAGTPAYTWIKYADTAAGAGLSDDPAGKTYIGLAHNKSTATESTTPGDYVWSLLKGGDGQPGAKGADGITYYTWIKYADQADGTGLYDAPNANTLYIGIAVNRTTATESTTKTDYVWSRFKGEQGVAGAPTYTWIKYADSASGVGLSDDPTGKAYIGFAYNQASATESTTATDYTWSLIKGTDGQPGGKGADGATLYTWIKYADVADGTGLYDTPTASTLYIGIATNKSTATESTVKTDYVWSKFKGDQGVQGPVTYTWVKYADSAAGAGLSDDPTGKAYIGFAYNKATATESTTATDYTWSLIKGTDGQPGGKGADGATLYTWIKYSDVADGTGLYDLPTASTQYLGIAVNKTTPTESTTKTDYVWSKFRGADGVGTAGARGAGHYYVAGSSWSDVVAQAACPGGPVTNDVVTISSGTFVMEKRWTGSAWVDNGVVINGKLIVPDSILASSIDTRNLTIRDSQGNVVISAGGLQPGFEAPGTKNSQISIGANGSLGGAGGGQVTLPGMGQNFFRIVAQGNQAGAKVPAIPGLYRNGTRIVDVSRSYTLVAIRRSDLLITHNRAYDVWGAGALQGGYGGPEFASDLNYFADRPGQFILVVMTHDEPKLNKAGAVETAMYRNGASRGVFGSPLFRVQSAYALVALSGCGEANGAEAYQGGADYDPNAWIDVGFTMLGGELSSVTLNYVPKTLQDYGFTGDMNATVGAPAGSMVAGSPASDVVGWAYAGAGARDMVDNPTTGLAQRLSKSAANILTGAGAIISGSLTVDANGYRSGGYGAAQTQRGWVAYNSSGVITFQVDASNGSAYFAGQLFAAYGSLGGLRMAPGGAIMGGGYVAKQSPPSGQGGFFLDETLFALGNYNDGRYVFLHASGDIEAPGLSLVNKQLTLTNTILISPQIAKIAGSLVSSPANSYYFTAGAYNTNAFAGAYEMNLTSPDGTETFAFNATCDNAAIGVRIGGVNGKRANLYVAGNGYLGEVTVGIACTVNRGGISSTFGVQTTVSFQ